MDQLQALLEIRRSLHELSQPLAAATGMIELLLLEMPEDHANLKEIQLVDQQLAKIVQILATVRRIAADASQTGAPIQTGPGASPGATCPGG